MIQDPELLKNNPSIRDGIPLSVEVNNRIYGCELISKAGILLQLPQVSIITGQVFFHLFYSRQSMKSFLVRYIAMGCIFLAAKVEEAPRKIRDVLNIFDRILKLETGKKPITLLEIGGSRYTQWKKQLKNMELHILHELGYVLYMNHPHRFILHYLHALDCENLAQVSWNLLNDSMRTTLCLRFPPQVIASGVIYLAARLKRQPLPDIPWWNLFDVENENNLIIVASVISELYTRPKVVYIPVDSYISTTTSTTASSFLSCKVES